ncbi:MAG: ABC transporter permease [Thermosphaera sp.]
MGTWQYVIRRLLQLVPTLFGLLVLIFVIARVMPGDPVRLALGPEATQQQIESLRRQLGLDDPLWLQFVNYVVGIFRGELGYSFRSLRDVSQDVGALLPATLELVLAALIIGIALGLPAGILSAVYRDTWIDNFTRLIAISGVALPRFWVAILFQIWLAAQLGLFPIIGRSSVSIDRYTGFLTVDSLLMGDGRAFLNVLWHLFLPALALALPTAAQIARLMRTSMINVLNQQYILVHRSYGLKPHRIILRYALRNSLTSTLTVLGMSVGALIENAFLVEVVFSWPGISAYGAAAVLYKDFNAVVAVTLVIGSVFLTVNLLVDLIYGLLDPRVRYD